jgi:uncharacterized membrane protein YraQ (UPF0718 family)
MGSSWFTFNLGDFSYAFLSVLLEGVPFLILGTLLSGLIDEFLPSRLMLRFLPRSRFWGVCAGAGLGLIFPMCECGIVPVIRRLIGKGLPISHAMAYMLAAPIVNPLVAVSTFAAFRGQGAVEFTILRLSLGYAVAVAVSLAISGLPMARILRPRLIASLGETHDHDGPHALPVRRRLTSAMHSGVRDFLDVLLYFILGVAIASVFSTAVNQKIILPFASNDWLAVATMMGLAGILALCSTSDAFIAATFVAFPAAAKLAFLVFGPMMDLKLIFIYSSVFRKRFVLGLAAGLFVLIGLICVRLASTGL